MTKTLFDHLEKHKGDQGLYMTDRQQAYSDLVKSLARLYPLQSISIRQVEIKFESLWSRKRKPANYSKETFFRKGVSLLNDAYVKTVLLGAEKNNSRTDQTMKAGKVRNSPISSTTSKKRHNRELANLRITPPPVRPPQSGILGRKLHSRSCRMIMRVLLMGEC